MAKNCSVCQKQLSFRDSFEWEGKPICKSCLDEVQKEGSPSETIKPQEEPAEQGKETLGGTIVVFIFSILVPVLSIWNGIEYLVKKELWKGISLLVIFVIQLIIIFSMVQQ